MEAEAVLKGIVSTFQQAQAVGATNQFDVIAIGLAGSIGIGVMALIIMLRNRSKNTEVDDFFEQEIDDGLQSLQQLRMDVKGTMKQLRGNTEFLKQDIAEIRNTLSEVLTLLYEQKQKEEMGEEFKNLRAY